MASGKPLKCDVFSSDGSNVMSSSGSTKLQHLAPLLSAANSLRSSGAAASSSHSSSGSSSQESDPVYLVGTCVHTSAQYMEQHRATLRGQPLPIQAELAAELADMGACCHLNIGRQQSHHSEVPNLLPRHRRIVSGASSAETPFGQADAAVKKSAAAADVGASGKLEMKPSLAQLQNLRKFSKLAGTGQPGSRSILTESTAKRRIVRRMMRKFPLSEADVQAIVDGIHEKCGRNFTETKRIMSTLIDTATAGARQILEKRTKSMQRLRAGRHSCQPGESTTEGGTSKRLSSKFNFGDIQDRPASFLTRLKSSNLDADNQVVCCTELEGQGEVVRTPLLESTMVSFKPPAFELVRTWTFDEAPVRRLRNPSLV